MFAVKLSFQKKQKKQIGKKNKKGGNKGQLKIHNILVFYSNSNIFFNTQEYSLNFL